MPKPSEDRRFGLNEGEARAGAGASRTRVGCGSVIDPENPVIRELVRRGFRIAMHAYLRDGRIRTTVAAKNPQTGETLQGWSEGDQAGAVRDLARRAGLTVSE